MVKENSFIATVDSLFKGMDSFITTKTIVGEPIQVDNVLIVPLADVSFGVGAGAFSSSDKNNGGGGMTGKISPSAVLVITNGQTKLVNIKNQETVVKILDMLPDLIPEVVNKITELIKGRKGDQSEEEKKTDAIVDEVVAEMTGEAEASAE